jgi:uncharacterized membrane protein YcaP (DUF421 family)
VQLGISWVDALAVVVSAVGVYMAFLVLVRIVGQRALAALSSFDFAAAITLGAVMGRAVLGYTPTLAAGVLGMSTLFALQSVFGILRRHRRVDRVLGNLPLLLLANGEVVPEHLQKAKISEDEVRQKLRLAGVRSYDDVAAVILERTGAVSVLRRGETIAAELVEDVRGRAPRRGSPAAVTGTHAITVLPGREITGAGLVGVPRAL